MALADQWRAIASRLPDDWNEVALRLTVKDDANCDRAAALLGPAMPGRRGKVITFSAARRGTGSSPELVRRLLRRFEAEGIDARLEVVRVATDEADPFTMGDQRWRPFVDQWDEAQTSLPADWSDLYAELELFSSDYLERGALLLAPANPARVDERQAFRFRVARRFGYGASSVMTRRCFERLDGESIRGSLRILWALSDTKPVATQGPVWYFGGKPV